MAFVNPNKPSGLSPVRYLNSAKYDGKAQAYAILAANTNPFFVGDIVKLVQGNAATSADVNGVPAITLATTGLGSLGVIIAVGTLPPGASMANPDNLNINNRPTGAQSKNYYAMVSDDPNIIYEVQEGGTGTNYTRNVTGRYVPFIYAAPATGVQVSGTQLDNSAGAPVTGPSDLLIMRFAPRVDNHFVTSPATGGGAQKWWVMLGLHQFLTRPAAV